MVSLSDMNSMHINQNILCSVQEHESEGGRTPLMKACRAGHLCTVQFLVLKNADINRRTTNNDHTPLSLACAGGHLAIVQFLLDRGANMFHKLKVCNDNSLRNVIITVLMELYLFFL